MVNIYGWYIWLIYMVDIYGWYIYIYGWYIWLIVVNSVNESEIILQWAEIWRKVTEVQVIEKKVGAHHQWKSGLLWWGWWGFQARSLVEEMTYRSYRTKDKMALPLPPTTCLGHEHQQRLHPRNFGDLWLRSPWPWRRRRIKPGMSWRRAECSNLLQPAPPQSLA